MSTGKITALVLAGVVLFTLAACAGKNAVADPEESATWTSDWEPYYTGDTLPEWEHDDIHPWEPYQRDKFFEQNQEKGREASENLLIKYPGIFEHSDDFDFPDDYAGAYINASGTFTVMLISPTKERAAHYGDICLTPIWVVAAEFSMRELIAARDDAVSAIHEWIKDRPSADVHISGFGIDTVFNFVSIQLNGLDCSKMERELNLPGCVQLLYDTFDSLAEGEVPYEPVNQIELKDGLTAELDSAYYPVAPEYVVCTIRNKTEEEIIYGFTSVFYKYHKGEWKLVPGNYNFSLAGFSFPPRTRIVTNILSSYIAERLGPRLYRVYPWGKYSQLDKDFFLEFAVSRDVEKQVPLDDILSTFRVLEDGKWRRIKEDWEWMTLHEVWNMDFEGFENYGSLPVEGAYKHFLMLYEGDLEGAVKRGMRFAFVDLRTGEMAYATEKDSLYSFFTYYFDGGKVSVAGQVNGKPAAFTASFENGKVVYHDEPFSIEKYTETEEVQDEGFNHSGPAIMDVWAPRTVAAGIQRLELTLKSGYSKSVLHLDADMYLQKLTPYGWETVSEYCGSIHEKASVEESVSVYAEFDAPLEAGLYRLFFTNIRCGEVSDSGVDYYDNYYFDTSLGFFVE